jgi:hypothetical protein
MYGHTHFTIISLCDELHEQRLTTMSRQVALSERQRERKNSLPDRTGHEPSFSRATALLPRKARTNGRTRCA